MRLIVAVLAMALCLLGCAASGIQLKTIEMHVGGEGDCMLMYWIADVAADPQFGTVDKTSGEPLTWPSGYTARWAGTEVEVLNRSREVVLTTGQRYRLSPAYANGYPNGPVAICAPAPCIEREPSDNNSIVECRLGESGPL